ncbi:MAG: hypothetical protein ACE5J6_03510, partial [Candidatus Bathyarchaeia archaeon]
VLATLTFEVVGYGSTPIHFDLDTGLLDYQAKWIMRGTINPDALKDGFFANVRDPEPETSSIHDVAVVSLKALPTSGYPGLPIEIDATIENQGDFQETFNVLVYAVRLGDGLYITIANEKTFLGVGASETLFFIWDTTDVPPGSYWVIAEAVLSEDSEPTDNIRLALVGGIYPRDTPKETNIFDMLASFGIMVLVVGLGTVPIIFFELLMSPKLRWPWRRSKLRT